MSGVKANIASASQPVKAAGHPVANAGQGEPSIDDILASIRDIISDQNRQADFAAEKAAAEVANRPPAATKVESIIGSVAAGHWTGNVHLPDADGVPTLGAAAAGLPENATASSESAARTRSNPHELEELIHLIGSSPPAPRPPRQAMWIDPQSNFPQKTNVAAKVVAEPANNTVPAQPVKVEAVADSVNASSKVTKPAVILPNSAPKTGQHTAAAKEIAVESRLHPSISPNSVIPQVIKEAIARPLAKTVAVNSQLSAVQMPDNSHKSALGRLIARKTGADVGPKPVVEAPVQQIVTPKAVATAPVQAQKLHQSASAIAQKPVVTAQSSGQQTVKTATSVPAPQSANNSPAISSQAVNAAVVKSIERLATSMFEGRKDEIDGMMAGIVRPMLQDWLEDNLPSMVERIVREEIERVSRGTHR